MNHRLKAYFINSEYFEESLDKCDRILKKYFDFPYKSCPDYELIHCVFHEGRFDKSFCHFYKQHMAICNAHIMATECEM